MDVGDAGRKKEKEMDEAVALRTLAMPEFGMCWKRVTEKGKDYCCNSLGNDY